jgi:hypothetical protein
VVLLGVIPPLLREANPDEAWSLYIAERVLAGAKHGIDFFEVNPPLHIWKSIPAVLWYELTGASPWKSQVALVVAFSVVSLLLTSRILRQAGIGESQRRTLILAAGATLLIFPRLEFSEREHWAFVCTLPFIALAGARAARFPITSHLCVAAGLVAGIGFSLKPHFLIAWILIEIWLLRRGRLGSLRRPEFVAVVLFGTAYFAATLWLTPEYFPMAVRFAPLYAEYLSIGMLGALLRASVHVLILLGLFLVSRNSSVPRDTMADALRIACIGFLAAAVVQGKGFPYHYLAAESSGLLFLVRSWQTRPTMLTWLPSGLFQRAGYLLACGVLGASMVDAARELVRPEEPRYRFDANYPLLLPRVKNLAQGEAIAVFSTTPRSAWPLTADAGAAWALRHMSLWPLSALYGEQLRTTDEVVRPRSSDRSPLEQEFVRGIVDDLERYRPRLIVLLMPARNTPGAPPPNRFDYFQHFASDERFGPLIAGYREVEQVGAYTLWTRNGAPRPNPRDE